MASKESTSSSIASDHDNFGFRNRLQLNSQCLPQNSIPRNIFIPPINTKPVCSAQKLPSFSQLTLEIETGSHHNSTGFYNNQFQIPSIQQRTLNNPMMGVTFLSPISNLTSETLEEIRPDTKLPKIDFSLPSKVSSTISYPVKELPIRNVLRTSCEPLNHTCKICNKKFTRPSSLRTHLFVHTGEKPFPCLSPGCGKTFSVKSNLRRHYLVHLKRERKLR